jgi:hypothetical protein
MFALSTLFRVFAFPRRDLESQWWHRLSKVLIFVSTILVCFLLLRWANETFAPYYAYSFEREFKKYSGKEKNFTEVDLSYSDAIRLVVAFKNSGDPNNFKYVADLEGAGKSDYAIAAQMKQDGLLEAVTVKDLQNDFVSPYQKAAVVLVLTVLFYLLVTHFLYRVLAYIIAGRPNTMNT